MREDLAHALKGIAQRADLQVGQLGPLRRQHGALRIRYLGRLQRGVDLGAETSEQGRDALGEQDADADAEHRTDETDDERFDDDAAGPVDTPEARTEAPAPDAGAEDDTPRTPRRRSTTPRRTTVRKRTSKGEAEAPPPPEGALFLDAVLSPNRSRPNPGFAALMGVVIAVSFAAIVARQNRDDAS
mgnify:CR=1 FL=1